ncbi:trichothecene efflux pump [Diaporthe amygdali]|uniref:trichothecene efflux pump n=1 Tax=Phomopsis amygdali TaxID=1214568 RepID=UPI0022FDC3CC|nr:trichothecene efflux pump [Diaporthe amygdali]KAJ0121963.1 trichothecene efflux pump [Diaporthe amygdali]
MSALDNQSGLAAKEPQSSHFEDERKITSDAHFQEDNVTKVTHADGAVDYIDIKAVGGDYAMMQRGYFRSPQFLGTLTAQCLASICAYVSWVLPSNTLSLINAELGPSPNITWVATMFLIGCSIGFLLVGRLSDLYGRKWMVLGTSVLGLVGCVIGSCAQNVETLIVANLCNGIASAGQLSFNVVMGELVPNKWRGPVNSIILLSSLPFAVFGPVIARSLFNNTVSKWRWSYYMGDILGVITLVLYWFFYSPPSYDQLHVHGKTRWQMTKDLDFVGILLYVAGCVLFLVGLSWGGSMYPWVSAEVLCTLLIGVATLAAFAVYEGFFCKVQPLMPPRMFRNVGFVAIVAVATIGAMVYFSLTVLWPTIIGTLYTTDVMQIGWQSSVVGGGVLLGQTIAGFSISYVPKVKLQCIVASALTLAFSTSLTIISPDRWAATIALGILLLISVGFIENISLPGVTLVWEAQDIGLATGVLGSIRSLGGAVATALYSSVLANELDKNLPKYVVPAATDAGLPESSMGSLFAAITAGDLSEVPGIKPEIIAAVGSALKTAYTNSFRIVFYTTIPFSVILLLSAFLVPDMEMFLSHNVAKKLQDTSLETVSEEKRETTQQV